MLLVRHDRTMFLRTYTIAIRSFFKELATIEAYEKAMNISCRLLAVFSLMSKGEVVKAFLTHRIPNNSLSLKQEAYSRRGFSSNRVFTMQSASSSSVVVPKIIAAVVFDNRNLRDLPVDKETRNFPRQVPNAIFSKCQPTPVQSPELIACSVDALALLGINISVTQQNANPTALSKETKNILEEYFSGNKLLPGSETSAHCYAGHQFGNFAGQLGDGAAIALGEVITGGERYELQLKGAGLTPFSRTADGRKVLRSSIREFLCSEAMHFLNIPTTRAATLVTSASTVERDPFYDGKVLDEKCTVVGRIASNYFRFGSFEIFKGDGGRKGPSAGNESLKKQLFDYVLQYYPDILKLEEEERYAAFYTEITKRTADLVARWQAVGFVHGVLNTDNMSIMGLTIDYGPFAFEEHFDSDFTPNGSDGGGRYTYGYQPERCKWNVKKLAEQLSPLLPTAHSNEILSNQWDESYSESYSNLMHKKLGLLSVKAGDKELIEEFFSALSKTRGDFTDSFQALTEYATSESEGITVDSGNKNELLENLVSRGASPSEMVSMLRRKMKIHRLGMQPGQIQQIWDIIQNNPMQASEMFGGAPIEAITAEIEGEKRNLERQMFAIQEIKRLESVTPLQKTKDDREIWAEFLVRYHARLGVEWGSEEDKQQSVVAMRAHNPTFVLRNWIAQDAIDAAEKGSYDEVNVVLTMLTTPFAAQYSTFRSDKGGMEGVMRKYTQTAPPGADGLICTCSS